MPLTVLSDTDVKRLLDTLDHDDVQRLQDSLGEALHSYSTGDTNSPCASSFQPQRTVIKKHGVTTLFMPASTGTSVGMKIVSLETPEAAVKKTPSADSTTSSLSSMKLSPASTIDSASSVSSVTGSTFKGWLREPGKDNTTPRGTVTMLDAAGYPTGIVNAEELTAFRTALAATFIIKKRQTAHTITVFGAGKQAYWHIRLSLLLRPDEIHHINIINRTFERSIELMKRFHDDGPASWRKVKFSALSPDFVDYGRLLKEEVRKADIIFCCTPSVEPLFPAEFLTSREGQRKGRYVSAIGSYAPHMVELHPDIMRHAVAPDHGHHHHKHAKTEGVVVVDSLEACLKEAGEVIQAKLRPEHLVELGELLMVKKAVHREVEVGGPGEKGLLEWLTRGNVIYKSVGMGLMDLVVGGDLVKLARERGIGTTIQDF